jgi:hypothetical protein
MAGKKLGKVSGGQPRRLGRRHAPRRDLTEEVEGQCLIAAFSTVLGKGHGPARTGVGVLDLGREQVRLAEL